VQIYNKFLIRATYFVYARALHACR